MEKERLESVEAERAIAEFSRKKESLMEHRQNLLKQIDETRNAIQKKRERRTPHIASDYIERSVERRAIAAQVSKNGPELSFWEEHLAMKIEGVKEDVLRIVYSHISETDWMREYSFTVDLSERDYRGAALDEPIR
jgi:kinetochore protein Spc25, fungi type